MRTSILLSILPSLLLASAPAYAQTDAELPYTETPPVIDGQWEELYDAGQAHVIENHRADSPRSDENDLSAWWQAAWDATHLYVFIYVQDDVVANTGIEDSWQEDSIELVLDGANDDCHCFDENDVMYVLRVSDEPSIYWGGSTLVSELEKFGADVTWATGEQSDGYSIEISIPLANVGVTEPDNGLQVGFDMSVNDEDGFDGTRDHKYQWGEAEGDHLHQWADYFATATLTGGPGEAVATARIAVTPSGRLIIGEEATFDGSASTAPGSIQSFVWDFGDGTAATDAVVTHTYSAKGAYDVTLTITDEGGVVGTETREVRVWDGFGRPETPLPIPRAPAMPEFDGVRESVWDGAQQLDINVLTNNALPESDEDFSAQAWVMWDEENFYAFFEVVDDALFNDSVESWRDDTAEIYIDGNNEKCSNCLDLNDGVWEYGWNADNITRKGRAQTPGEDFVWANTDVGYNVEAIIPWGAMNIDFAPGHVIGFEAMVNDSDSEGSVRDTKFAWYNPIDEAWQWASYMGTAVLVDQLPSAAERDHALPYAFSITSVYPNPFNPTTNVVLDVRRAGRYEIRAFNALGQRVYLQAVEVTAPGTLSVALELGGQASGMYLLSISELASGRTATQRVVLVK